MSKPQVRIYTGNGEFIDREMNDEEFAQWQLDSAKAQAKAEAANQASLAKATLLQKLGITEEEAKLLLS